MIVVKNLIQGQLISGSIIKINTSPIDGKEISRASLLSEIQLKRIFEQMKNNQFSANNDFHELIKLSEYIVKNRHIFVNQIVLDSGFTQKDSEDLVDASIEFCLHYHSHLNQILVDDKITNFSFRKGFDGKIRLSSEPYGLIAATTPRNTPLITELTILIHALWSGNSLVLRPSLGVAGTVALLIKGLRSSFGRKRLERFSIVFSDAKDFVLSSLESANLLHYVGSSKYLQQTLIAGIHGGVKVLVDGDGCTMVIVDKSANIQKAAKYCRDGLIRCNGEICISIRAIIIEESIHEEFIQLFLDLIRKIKIGPPDKNNTFQMGPLFSQLQVKNIQEISQRYTILYSENGPLAHGENYISPIILQLKSNDHSFLRESLFGPMVGVAKFKGSGWKKWLVENPINLTDVVFSNDKNFIKEFITTSTSPRKVLNLDPTIESVFEPWGAYLPSGSNDVSFWYEKYRRYYQLVQG
ncbi:hypothetical protein CO051_04040 [Candidatus Roizmanbacteria bacterium CG_4_9_14_0_2_um_filter_39_13]|uniref:Aldehyde dehydrogenase domain-containing protein n=2 Tax=Candidatus Roizmaniibacteriota TaxID=1752723 RepID=A0A2M8EYI7_9BACT|nr:MAG: hypothetical protein COY15_01015 [Candidatus Roizmanbacteria bacterium CG_4_10_14_0_2_um_filter_39_12]PJC31607.1 MAG: hypothetical protein CO051_04040 [Candidatus Roizmanbacteria bacterium CG_4_9_14_0_2_um_filter_39_13]PJE61947.1 MAG: hypothetical protein COU87_01890 [Candidatus Roizmanbacteria bacterium CG10_big_fil_rev_8_21_14_0_10_39_12]